MDSGFADDGHLICNLCGEPGGICVCGFRDAAKVRRLVDKIERLRAAIDGLAKAHETTVGLLGLVNKCQCEWHKKWRALRTETGGE